MLIASKKNRKYEPYKEISGDTLLRYIWACLTIRYFDLLYFYYQLRDIIIFSPNYHPRCSTTKFKVLAVDGCLILTHWVRWGPPVDPTIFQQETS